MTSCSLSYVEPKKCPPESGIVMTKGLRSVQWWEGRERVAGFDMHMYGNITELH
jgi:hypothetical protein